MRDTIDLAQRADALGYRRYWVTEHHNSDVWHGSPETLLPVLASATHAIRIGTAGVLLNLRSPFAVAKSFAVLETAFPRRVDLGIGAGRSVPMVEQAFVGSAPISEAGYRKNVGELLGYLSNPHYGVHRADVGHAAPWLLGTGGLGSAGLAAEHGVGFSLGLFFAQEVRDAQSIAHYREKFRPSGFLDAPTWNVAVGGVCAPTERRARQIAAGYWCDSHRLRVVGTPSQCAEQLHEIAARFDAREIVFMDGCQRLADRIVSQELLANALGLRPPQKRAPTERHARTSGLKSCR